MVCQDWADTQTSMKALEPQARALLAPLKNLATRGVRLRVADLRALSSRAGWFRVAIGAVKEKAGRETLYTPLMEGILSLGGRGVKPWVECRIFARPAAQDGTTLDARKLRLEQTLIEALAQIVPPGGHLMVDYESPGQEQTFEELNAGIPPPASHLGALMLQAGFRGDFKDWYFSEGGHEGPRKLQGNKPPDAAAEARALKRHRAALAAFVAMPAPAASAQAAVFLRARRRARALLHRLAAPRRQTRWAAPARPARPQGQRHRPRP